MAGLVDLGNTCYLNAVVQALGSLREFMADMWSVAKTTPGRHTSTIGLATMQVLDQMRSNFKARQPSNPAALRDAVAAACPRFAGNLQQDAHDFLLVYLNQLHDELQGNNGPQVQTHDMDAAKGISPMPVSRHFESKINKRISCVQCMATRDVVERFRDFSLDFQVDDREASALQRMINAYFDPEVLQVECDQCGASEALVRKELTKAPPVLVLHLKRFAPHLEGNGYSKCHQAIDTPSLLDLSLVTCGRIAGGSSAVDVPAAAYCLRAVITHVGNSPHSGHYVCHTRNSAGRWFLFDDTTVIEQPRGFMAEKLGDRAYILFYVMNDTSSTSALDDVVRTGVSSGSVSTRRLDTCQNPTRRHTNCNKRANGLICTPEFRGKQ